MLINSLTFIFAVNCWMTFTSTMRTENVWRTSKEPVRAFIIPVTLLPTLFTPCFLVTWSKGIICHQWKLTITSLLQNGFNHCATLFQIFISICLYQNIKRFVLIRFFLIIYFTLKHLRRLKITLFWEPFPLIWILHLLSFSNFCWVYPPGPIIYPI